jgi:hypothetical protein
MQMARMKIARKRKPRHPTASKLIHRLSMPSLRRTATTSLKDSEEMSSPSQRPSSSYRNLSQPRPLICGSKNRRSRHTRPCSKLSTDYERRLESEEIETKVPAVTFREIQEGLMSQNTILQDCPSFMLVEKDSLAMAHPEQLPLEMRISEPNATGMTQMAKMITEPDPLGESALETCPGLPPKPSTQSHFLPLSKEHVRYSSTSREMSNQLKPHCTTLQHVRNSLILSGVMSCQGNVSILTPSLPPWSCQPYQTSTCNASERLSFPSAPALLQHLSPMQEIGTSLGEPLLRPLHSSSLIERLSSAPTDATSNPNSNPTEDETSHTSSLMTRQSEHELGCDETLSSLASLSSKISMINELLHNLKPLPLGTRMETLRWIREHANIGMRLADVGIMINART